MKPISPCLWCDGTAEEAAKFYTSVFPNSKILSEATYPESGKEQHGQKPGSMMFIEMELNGCKFSLLNGGPQFKHSEAVSFMIECRDQNEIDDYWRKLTADGGQEVECGWVKDKFGLSWQIVPDNFSELMNETGPDGKERYMAAMMQMKKLDKAALERAARGESQAA